MEHKLTKSVTFNLKKKKDEGTIGWLKQTGRYNGGAFSPFVRQLLLEARLREEGGEQLSYFSLDDIRRLIREEVGQHPAGEKDASFVPSRNGNGSGSSPAAIHQALAQELDERHLSLPAIRRVIEAVIESAGVNREESAIESAKDDGESWMLEMLEEAIL
jgi:hypothetical protein